MTLACFKAYDIRGKLGEELNEDIAYRIGRAYAQHLNARRVVVGGDARLSSEPLKQALANGLMDGGADVIDIGMTGTEEVYFAAFHLDVDGGIEVTASHNPMDYNGMKLVARGAVPISGDTGLKAIQALAEANQFSHVTTTPGKLTHQSILAPFVEHLLTYIDTAVLNPNNSLEPALSLPPARGKVRMGVEQQKCSVPTPSLALPLQGGGDTGPNRLSGIKPLRLVVNSGNGAAGHVIDALEARFKQQGIPVGFIKVHHQPDGTFPNGIPNPLLPENRAVTAEAVRAHQADMGIAWDGDFDRCFMFDENGKFIEGYYIVGLLAAAFLAKHPGEKIIHDPRLTWNTIDQVKAAGGIPVQSKTGHAFIKERMRAENAIYGGEMSAHHYFRDFAYCDSGMIPWLLVAELLSRSGKPLSQLVGERIKAYPCSGEINYQVSNVPLTIEHVLQHYTKGAVHPELVEGGSYPIIDRIDGVSVEFPDWRFNLRGSNTEPLLRLNVETRGDLPAVLQHVRTIEALITDCSLGLTGNDFPVSVRPELVEGHGVTVPVVRSTHHQRPNEQSGLIRDAA